MNWLGVGPDVLTRNTGWFMKSRQTRSGFLPAGIIIDLAITEKAKKQKGDRFIFVITTKTQPPPSILESSHGVDEASHSHASPNIGNAISRSPGFPPSRK